MTIYYFEEELCYSIIVLASKKWINLKQSPFIKSSKQQMKDENSFTLRKNAPLDELNCVSNEIID